MVERDDELGRWRRIAAAMSRRSAEAVLDRAVGMVEELDVVDADHRARSPAPRLAQRAGLVGRERVDARLAPVTST